MFWFSCIVCHTWFTWDMADDVLCGQMGLDGAALEQVVFSCLPYLSKHQPDKLQQVHGSHVFICVHV